MESGSNSISEGAVPLDVTLDAGASAPAVGMREGATLGILLALSFSHMLNDTIQSLISAIYPLLKQSFKLDYAEIGLITLTFQLTASILQPVVGLYTDKKPLPYSLALGMGSTLIGLVLLSQAESYGLLLFAAALVGTGSSVFHPEASRVARMASGGRHGMAQSLFQVGGSVGSSLGPLMAAFIVLRNGQGSVAWFSLVALAAILTLTLVGRWYARELAHGAKRPKKVARGSHVHLSRGKIAAVIGVLFLLVVSKHLYLASFGSYYNFFMIEKFGLPAERSQLFLFVFLVAAALGTLIGGPVGDRIGRKYVIWVSILGVLPFSLALPYVGLGATAALSVVIGLIISSAFPAIVVYAQELVPGRVGVINGIFFGFAFGIGGLGAAGLGELADRTSIEFVFRFSAFLPILGLLAILLPDIEGKRAGRKAAAKPAAAE